jgi:hypothetical protein
MKRSYRYEYGNSCRQPMLCCNVVWCETVEIVFVVVVDVILIYSVLSQTVFVCAETVNGLSVSRE